MTVPSLNPVSQLYLPRAVSSALSGPDHPDVPWSTPARLPGLNDLQAALKVLEGRMLPVPENVLAACFAYLASVFEPNGKLGAAETKLRLNGWRVGCGDMPADLFQLAAEMAVQQLKWMPKPVELRELVADRLEKRSKAIARVKLMLDAVDRPQAFQAEPLAVRFAAMRDSFRRIGRIDKAEQYERALASLDADAR